MLLFNAALLTPVQQVQMKDMHKQARELILVLLIWKNSHCSIILLLLLLN